MDAGGFAPGWYVDPMGAWRWWTGSEWGPYAPAAPPTRSHGAAAIAHIGGITGGFIVPLIVYLVTDKDDRYTRHHAATALNWQLTFLIAYLGGFAIAFIGMIATLPASTTTSAGANAAPPAGFFLFIVVWGVLMLAFVANLVLSIIGIVKASKGEWWHYPVRIRFVEEPGPELV